VIRVFVLYSEAPDPEAYAEHVSLNLREVPEAMVRHGRILGSAQGKAEYAYYFEYEFPDRETWDQAREGLLRAAEDAQKLGVPFKVYFAELEVATS
jgi:hypothetical protein